MITAKRMAWIDWLINGFYTVNKINFDPRNNHGDWVAQHDDSQGVWRIPAELKFNSGGADVPFYYTVMETEEYSDEYRRLMDDE